MSRLADYFVVVGYDHEKSRSGEGCGRILQRYPERDWDHCPFTQGIELFCQPDGWQLSAQKQQPTYFVSVLTDIDADRHYCAVFTFSEDVAVVSSKIHDEDEEPTTPSAAITTSREGILGETGAGGLVQSATMFAPKSLVLVSRLKYFETFRNCLSLIYTAYIESMQVELETLIGNILGCIQVPPPGGPQVRFSIGAGDRQALQPPLCSTLPTTYTDVFLLFQHLGISNAVSVFCAALTDHKVLFHSQSYSRLTAASHATIALMYPLKYSYVYIPILPLGLIEVLNTPTPFIAGVHSSIVPDVADLLDVIVADLDGGSIRVPEQLNLSLMPEPIHTRLLHCLSMVLHPQLQAADYAFTPPPSKPQQPEILDKEIRSIFLRMFAELMFGYRYCLTMIRIHPEPVITFHKASFLGQRNLVDDEFISRVLGSMSFNGFVGERGPPYRVCDIFDEVFASTEDMLINEEKNPSRLLHNIHDLGQQLYTNENPNPQPYAQKIPRPPDGAHTRLHQPLFPVLDRKKILDIIEDGIAKHSLKTKLSQIRPQQSRIVPMGGHIASRQDRTHEVSTNARRLEVLRNCVTFIFDNKISDARVIYPAVLRALKTKVARLALVRELSHHVSSNRAMLEHQQFDLVVRLINCALQNDSTMDEHGVAAAILPLVTAFCRKLCTGVLQFAYTCVQEHAVWASSQFWEAAFYQDVQHQIQQLYLPAYEQHLLPNGVMPESPPSSRDKKALTSTPDAKRKSVMFKARNISALEIAAEQRRTWSGLTRPQQLEMINNEENIVYSQAIHYANRMVYMRVPLDASKSLKDMGKIIGLEGESNSSNITNSVAESDSYDAESGFEEQEVSELGNNVVKFVTRFVDKVCCESGVTSDHIKSLHQMVPGVVSMHIETLESVHQESKRLPPIQKPKILSPTLLPGEEIVMEGLRVYVIPDGREDAAGGNMGGPALFPAEGAIFLTSYRIIFKGTPCDPLACEQVVCRSLPASALTREKQIRVQYLAHLDQWLQEGLQLRSNTFQLLKIAFDEEVKADDIDAFRKLVNKVRYPASVFHTYAFTGYTLVQPAQFAGSKAKEKNASLKGFAKRTLMKTAKKAGFKTKEAGGGKRQKYLTPTPPLARRVLTGLQEQEARSRPVSISGEDELSVIDEQEMLTAIQSESTSVDRLSEYSYCRDYARLGLGSLHNNNGRSRTEPFRLSLVNSNYTVCRSYPAVLVVPQSVGEDSIRRFARSHRQYRLPVVTWRHPCTKAVLLRASGFHGKGVMGMLKGHHNTPHGSGGTDTTSTTSTSMEQEKYISAIVNSTPSSSSLGNSRFSHVPSAASSSPASSLTATPSLASSSSESINSLDSLIWMASSGGIASDPLGLGEITPRSSRRNPLSRAFSGLRSSGGKAKSSTPMSRSKSDHSFLSPLPWYRRKKSQQLGYSSTRNSLSLGTNRSLGRAASLRAQRPMSSISLQYTGTPKQNGTIDFGELSDMGGNSLHRAALYVLGEKTQMKGIKLDSFPRCDFIPVDYYEVRHVKSSFKKLLRACVPSTPFGSSDADRGFLKAVEDSEWMLHLQNILLIAGATVDLLDVQGSSVMICLEDGWDFTTQVMSVAQICLDPYYRTIEGFRTLVEKEWLSFGHRFTHRSNQTTANQASGFAPVFLQFLDVVHQIHHQFPLSFEFNQYFLKLLAYHYVSNRFRTFMLDSEFERMEAGWLLDQSMKPPPQEGINGSDTLTARHVAASGECVWDYIAFHHKNSPIFLNVLYSPKDQETVLRPFSNISNLKIWSYYIEEDLAHGPSYDIEVVAKETQIELAHEMIVGPPVKNLRKIVNGCYDRVADLQPDAFVHFLLEMYRAEEELMCHGVPGHTEPLPWYDRWQRLVSPSSSVVSRQLQRQVSFSTQLVRYHGRSIHKRSTVELLVKGKMLGEASKMFSQPHHFEKFTYTTPAYCDYCHHVLWGLAKTGMRCSDCAYNCHEKCMSHVPKNCTKLRSVPEVSGDSHTNLSVNLSDTASVTGGLLPASSNLRSTTDAYQHFSSAVIPEHRSHEGNLFKRGALLKGWKQRYFVLDSMKHQLRYYDCREDSHCKGFIDLKEVVSVGAVKNVQNAPKKADENAYFEMRTMRRLYSFLAPEAPAANKWIDEIQSCIQ